MQRRVYQLLAMRQVVRKRTGTLTLKVLPLTSPSAVFAFLSLINRLFSELKRLVGCPTVDRCDDLVTFSRMYHS
jgi:hypothetical protein